MSYLIGTATDVGDLVADLDAFLRVGHSLDPVYSRDGDGLIDAILGTATSVQETITVTFSDATHFSVAGSVSGALGSGTCGSAFSSSVVSFTITAGTVTPFANGDTISFVMTPPWTRLLGSGNVASASSAWDVRWNPPDVAFDGLASSVWVWGTTTGWIEIDLPASKTVASYAITHRSDGYATQAPKNWTFEYWNGSAWTVADTRTNITFTVGQRQTFTIPAPPTATKFRLNVSANGGDSSNCSLATIEILEQTTGTNVALGTVGLCVYQAPGNNGSTSSIFVGWQRFSDPTGDYDDLRLLGSIGWDPSLSPTAQPGAVTSSTPSPVIPLLRVGSMPYWIAANGQRVAFTVKASTVYESAYLGFLNQYVSPTLWPMPLVVAGSYANMSTSEPGQTSTQWRWSYTGSEHQAYPRGGGNVTNDLYYPCRVRLNSGTWRGFGAQFNGSYGAITPEYGLGQDLRPGIDGSYPLFPLVLSDSSPAIYGELDGVAYVSGHANTSENRVVQKRIPWIVFQNIFRTNKYDYFAMKLA